MTWGRSEPGPKAVLWLLALLSACQDSRQAALPEIDASFELVDESGHAVTADSYTGRVRLVFFGFASCPDVCPMTLHNLAAALTALGPMARQVDVLFISVDPKRDTPDTLARYTDAIHPSIIGLTGTYDQIAAAASGFRTAFGYSVTSGDGTERSISKEEYEALPPTSAYTPYHSSRVFLLNRNGELLELLGHLTEPAFIEEKLRLYIDKRL